tara:strand:+ start:1045 stop:1245 length:201 start_codon:yes stop_codon:yes gene_type:complete
MPSSSPNNRDLLLTINNQLIELQAIVDKVNFQMITSKSDILAIKEYIKSDKPKTQSEVAIEKGWLW